MRGWIFLLLLARLVNFSMTQQTNSLTWLSYLRNRAYSHGYGRSHNNNFGSLRTEDEPSVLDCPLECECPSTYPKAMYCNNRRLQHVPFVPSHIEYVYLQNNQITSITNGVFDDAPNLAWISMHTNKLSSDKIGENVFAKLPNLERLFLHNNNLSRVPQGLPRSLRDLHMNHNNISVVPVDSFRGMSNLTALYLQMNAIEDLGNALEDLLSLTLLDLRGNRLKKIPESLPPKLSQLYLEYNRISSIPADFLSQRPELRFVRLSHNQLTNGGIPANAFNVSTLVELDLSFNKLERIPTISTSLENLYLQANKIKEFSVSSFCRVVDTKNYSNLRVLRLDANEISAQDIPTEAVLCLRLATNIDL
ncbi:fibromodulin-like [Ctenopharyngodon idella]|uniref:fibromodulin n=1 Tax=Ctenopharyngodon idella TaxID=7959 RepID=UPI00222E6AA7|nr:fibromodulin [Ctenopharyngodon idella]XP_051760093.1 fibromodulin-like [Ctenopharyngodon idella]